MKRSSLIATICCTLLTPAVVAGDLEPPAAPAPTMKTLQQVEPRTPIHAADLPLTITASGSYYLAEDISATGDAIIIDASKVTLDLRGFSLTGNGSGKAVDATANASEIEVLNGTVSNFSYGIMLTNATDSRAVNLRVDGVSYNGISLGQGGQVIDCQSNSNSRGIYVNSHGAVRNSVARNNSDYGISGGIYLQIEDCLAEDNGTNGVHAGSGSIIRNTIAKDNGTVGIQLNGSGGIVEGCSAAWNDGGGIEVKKGVLARHNQCYANLVAGVHATDTGNRIEGNHMTGNEYGLVVDADKNTIVRNSVRESTTANYDIAAGNDVGPLGVARTATSPWANLSY